MDEAGQPMSGVRVRIESLTSDDSTLGSFRDTDDRGEFRVFGLAPGRYRICAEPTRFNYSAATPPDAPAAACVPATDTDDDALTIGNREPAPVEIRMVRGGTLTISGAILDAFGAPAEGATLSFSRRPSNGSSSYGIPVSPGGQFAVRGVSPGDYSLTATGGRAVDNGQIERQYAYLPLHVGSGDIAGLTIRLIRPVNVTGRVIVEDGTPLPAGVRLSMQARLDAPMLAALNRTVPTGIVQDDMRFELPGVFGAMTLSSTGLPHGWIVKAVRYEGIDVTDRSFTPGGDAPSIDVVVSSRGAIASGTVTGEDGAPAGARALVWMFPTDPGLWDTSFAVHLSQTSDRGAFTLEAVRAGEYFIAATERGAMAGGRSVMERLVRVAQRITLGEGDHRAIDLRIVKVPEAP